jgi:hypothetical protein
MQKAGRPQLITIRWRIAGLLIEVAHDERRRFQTSQAIQEYSVPNDESCADVRVVWRQAPSLPEIPSAQLVYEPGDVWKLRAVDGVAGYIVDVYYGHRKPVAQMTVDRNWTEVDFLEKPVRPNSYSVLCLGGAELLIRTRLLDCSGIVFHAGGIDDHGDGIMFVGHSGAGKSTQALLWANSAGSIPMNDDRIAVRLHGPEAIMHGLPWGGTAKLNRNHSAPLRAVVLLEQAEVNAISEVPAQEAVTSLVARSFLPYWDSERLDMAIDTIERLVTRVPLMRLRCRPEPSVIDLVRSVLR